MCSKTEEASASASSRQAEVCLPLRRSMRTRKPTHPHLSFLSSSSSSSSCSTTTTTKSSSSSTAKIKTNIQTKNHMMKKKKKFISLCRDLSSSSSPSPSPSPCRDDESPNSPPTFPVLTTTNESNEQLDLFPLDPGNLCNVNHNAAEVKEGEPKDHEEEEENVVSAYLFESENDGEGASLNGFLWGGGGCTLSTTCTHHYYHSFSPCSSSMLTYASASGVSCLLERTALRHHRRHHKYHHHDEEEIIEERNPRNQKEEKWVCYSQVVLEEEEKKKKTDALSCCVPEMDYNLLGSGGGSGLSLKLDYEEIINAWSDKGPLYVFDDPPPPQVVPDLHHDYLSSPAAQDNIANHVIMMVPQRRVSAAAVGNCDEGSRSSVVVDDVHAHEDQNKLGGSREARVLRYKEKRRSRLFSKRIRYQVRKLNAEKRPRIKGRFVKRS